MLLAGDELLNSQQGNNNGYCQNNELSWIDWNLTQKNADNLRFVQLMVALRKRHPAIMRRRFLTGRSSDGKSRPDIVWHGHELDKPLWSDPDARLLAFTLASTEHEEPDLHIVMNMSDEAATINLPQIKAREWCLAVDTTLPSPSDIIPRAEQKALNSSSFLVGAKAVVVFENSHV
jgi:glycogen operon protein